jgi:hypothetical protein
MHDTLATLHIPKPKQAELLAADAGFIEPPRFLIGNICKPFELRRKIGKPVNRSALKPRSPFVLTRSFVTAYPERCF